MRSCAVYAYTAIRRPNVIIAQLNNQCFAARTALNKYLAKRYIAFGSGRTLTLLINIIFLSFLNVPSPQQIFATNKTVLNFNINFNLTDCKTNIYSAACYSFLQIFPSTISWCGLYFSLRNHGQYLDNDKLKISKHLPILKWLTLRRKTL